jgi:hypothetical protein
MTRKKRQRKQRERPRPPEAVLAYAAAYECSDCDAETRLVREPAEPVPWTIEVYHDENCPVLNGHVPASSAGLSAAAKVPGRVLYVPVVDEEAAR